MSKSSTIEVTDETFARDVLHSHKPVLVDFWAPGCSPCRMVLPVLEEIAHLHADKLTVAKLDADANPATSTEYGVLSLPTMILFSGGREIKRIVGARGKSALLIELEAVL